MVTQATCSLGETFACHLHFSNVDEKKKSHPKKDFAFFFFCLHFCIRLEDKLNLLVEILKSAQAVIYYQDCLVLKLWYPSERAGMDTGLLD